MSVFQCHPGQHRREADGKRPRHRLNRSPATVTGGETLRGQSEGPLGPANRPAGSDLAAVTRGGDHGRSTVYRVLQPTVRGSAGDYLGWLRIMPDTDPMRVTVLVNGRREEVRTER